MTCQASSVGPYLRRAALKNATSDAKQCTPDTRSGNRGDTATVAAAMPGLSSVLFPVKPVGTLGRLSQTPLASKSLARLKGTQLPISSWHFRPAVPDTTRDKPLAASKAHEDLFQRNLSLLLSYSCSYV